MAIDCKANSFKVVRWTLALLVLAACVGGLLTSTFSVCNVETATTKGEETVTKKTCDGPTVTDAGVVAVALLIVLLLSPDMSEVGIFGVSLKRRLEAAETKAASSEAKVDKLESQLQVQNLRVDTLSQNLASASATGIGQLIINGDQIQRVDSAMAEKVKTFNWDTMEKTLTEVQPPPTTEEPAPDPTLVWRIIQNWETIAATLELSPKVRGGRGDGSRTKLTPDQISRFRMLFEEEIQIVRAAGITSFMLCRSQMTRFVRL